MQGLQITLSRKELQSHLRAVAEFYDKQYNRGLRLVDENKEKYKQLMGTTELKASAAMAMQAVNKLAALAAEWRTYAEKLSAADEFVLSRDEAIKLNYPIDMLIAGEIPDEVLELTGGDVGSLAPTSSSVAGKIIN